MDDSYNFTFLPEGESVEEHFPTLMPATLDSVKQSTSSSGIGLGNSPAFILPPTCTDLPMCSPQLAFDAAVVYEALNMSLHQLSLSQFRFEDFCAAIGVHEECGSLLNEVFVALLRYLLRDSSVLSYLHPIPVEGRKSFHLWLNSLDVVTWPAICCALVTAAPFTDRTANARSSVNLSSFPFVTGSERLAVLRYLVDLLLMIHPDMANKKSAVPEEKNSANIEYSSFLSPHLIGIDNQNRRFWFLSRRLFIEHAKEKHIGCSACLAYYSSKEHIRYIIGQLAGNEHNQQLHEALISWLSAIELDVVTTKTLTEQELARFPQYQFSSTALQFDINELARFENNKALVDIDDSKLFRLGDGAFFRCYRNALAINKQQQIEESDKDLPFLFCVTPPNSRFYVQWRMTPSLSGELTWTPLNLVDALRQALLLVESSIPRSNAFFMPAWLSSSLCCRWRRAVELTCHSADQFALALILLVSNLRLVSFLPSWCQLTGHIRLSNTPGLSISDEPKEGTWKSDVKFSKKVRHKIWKEQGEEYRLTAGDGWCWLRCGQRGGRYSKQCLNLRSTAAKYWQEHTSDLPSNCGDVVDVSAALISRDLYPLVPGTACPVLDDLLLRRLEAFDDIKSQQQEIMKIVDALRQGRRMTDIFPPFLLPLPDSLPKEIRSLPITHKTSVGQLLELSSKLSPRTDESVCLQRKKVISDKNVSTSLLYRFQTRPNMAPNIFILPRHIAKWLGRKGGLAEVPGYQASSATWYRGLFPAPTLQTAWQYRTSSLCHSPSSFAGVALQLRILAASLRFNDMALPPPHPSSCPYIEKTGSIIKTRELVGARVHSLEPHRFEYLAKIITANDEDGSSDVSECWLPDSSLELFEIRFFHETVSRKALSLLSQGHLIVDDSNSENRPTSAVSPSTAVVKVPSPSKQPQHQQQQQQQSLQELRITQLPSGQVQIKGLLPDQYMLRVPDGSFQLVTLTPTMPIEHALVTPQKSQKNDRLVTSPLIATSTHSKSAVDINKLKRDLKDRASRLKLLIIAKRIVLEQRYCAISANVTKGHLDSSPVSRKLQGSPKNFSGTTPPPAQIPQPSNSVVKESKQVSRTAEIPKETTTVEIREPSTETTTVSTSKKRQASSKESPTRTNKAARRTKASSEMDSLAPTTEPTQSQPVANVLQAVSNEKQNKEQAAVEPAGKTTSDNVELYCTCRTPYDPALFYIGCEKCGDWFHGSCVGITEEAAQSLDIYYCNACQIKLGAKKCETVTKTVNAIAKPAVSVAPSPSEKKSTETAITTAAPITTATTAVTSNVGTASTSEKINPALANAAEKSATPTVPPPEGTRSTRTRAKSIAQPPAVSKEPETTPTPKAIQAAPSSIATSSLSLPAPSSSKVCGKKQAISADKTTEAQLPASPSSRQGTSESGGGGVGEELYCICKTPYDDTEFYIGCDKCGDWFHGYCVFVAECEAKNFVNWVCARCRGGDDESHSLLNKEDLWRSVEQVLAGLQKHKKSWPFRAPVDRALYPLYYAVIRRPIDLSLIATRVSERRYATLEQLKYDVLLMLDNCRRFNPPESKFTHCAEELQTFFLDRYKALLSEHSPA